MRMPLTYIYRMNVYNHIFFVHPSLVIMYYVLCPGYDIFILFIFLSSTERFIYKTRTAILDDGEGKHYADISCGRGDNITVAKRRGKYPESV